MRRNSWVVPLLLIVVGAVLLANNLTPDLPLLSLAAKYWPFLLVVWGGLRLVEVLAWAMKGDPLPRSNVSGGEWAVAILICLIGVGTDFARTTWSSARLTRHGVELLGQAFDYPVQARQEAGESPLVIVENLYGNVRIVGGDAPLVAVEGRTTVRSFDEDGAREVHEKCPLEVISQGGQVVIRTNHGQASGPAKITSDLQVTVPRGASIQASGRYGDFDVANVSGDVDIESDNAGVRLAEIGGDVRVDLKKSDIIRVVNLTGKAELKGRGQDVELDNVQGEVTIGGSYSGDLIMRRLAKPLHFDSQRTDFRVEQTPGEVRMDLGDLIGEDLVGPISLKTTSRDVEFDGFTGRLELDIDRGDVELSPGAEPALRMKVQLGAGDIVLTLPEGAAFGLDARTTRGEIINDYGPELRLESNGDGASLRGPDGRDVTVLLEVKRGDIILRKSPARPALTPERPAREDTARVLPAAF